jgi:hypothetical protein
MALRVATIDVKLFSRSARWPSRQPVLLDGRRRHSRERRLDPRDAAADFDLTLRALSGDRWRWPQVPRLAGHLVAFLRRRPPSFVLSARSTIAATSATSSWPPSPLLGGVCVRSMLSVNRR